MQLEAAIISDTAAIPSLAKGWQALASIDAETPFQTFQWHAAWWELVGRYENVLPYIVAFFANRGLCGIAPFAVRDECGERVLEFSSSPWADYHDILVDRSGVAPDLVYREVAEIIGRGLQERRWSRVALRDLSPNSAFAVFVESKFGSLLSVVPGVVCPRADLATVENSEHFASKSEYAIKQRRLERLGRLECLHHTNPQQIARRMPTFMAMHLQQWISRPDCGLTFDRPEMVRFYTGCVSVLGAAGNLMLAELLLDGRPIGYYFGFLHRRTFWGYRTTFDTGLRKYSPGGVMHRLLFRFLHGSGYDTFDFMRADNAYKRRYSTEVPRNRDVINGGA
jgi:CelD/BcsL family acetyltransferase involved in cellulose biosynthesis